MPTTLLEATADNFGRTGDTFGNFGASALLSVGHSGVWAAARSLLKWNLVTIPVDAVLVSARIQLYRIAHTGVNNNTMQAFRVLRNWDEMTSSWEHWTGMASDWTTWMCAGAGTDRDPAVLGSRVFIPGEANGYKPIDLPTSLITAWLLGAYPNYGVLLQASVENDNLVGADSRHVVAGTRPLLEISWNYALGRLPAYIVDGLQGGITLKATVEQFANEVWARHTPVGGALIRTPAAHSIDAASQAKYGRKDQPLSGGAASVTIADQISDTYLSFQSTPNMPDITLAPGTIIKDQNGNVVPPEEIRPNNWMLIENLALPTGQVWASLTANPMALYLEEVTYSEDSGLQITAGRDRFTQALVARIAGRGGG